MDTSKIEKVKTPLLQYAEQSKCQESGEIDILPQPADALRHNSYRYITFFCFNLFLPNSCAAATFLRIAALTYTRILLKDATNCDRFNLQTKST